jgi:outer membrane lipoprotein-sorting protein
MNQNIRSRRGFISALAAGLVAPVFAPSGVLAAEPEAPSQADEAARKLVARADEIRFPRESFQTDITITNYSNGQAGDERKYQILSRGNEDTIVLSVEPASERGQALLMRGRDLWVFMPSVSQPVRLSLAQRLTGQVANGDLARANLAGDYHPAMIGTESVDGVPAHVLDLTAVDRSVTYAKVKYWVAQKDARPIQAEFYALSGRLLKTCRYEEFRELAGRTRPTRLVMEDALKKGDKSVLVYESMKLRDLPERMFTREYLRRLN